MKPIHTLSRLRLLLPAAALMALGMCMAPLSVQGSPGHSSASRSSFTLAPADRSVSSETDAVVSESPYGNNFGFEADGAFFQPVGDLDVWINRAAQYYDRYRGQRSQHRRYDRDDRYSRSYRGYYPNDPDDRNNPRHPDYIGPPGSYGGSRYRSYPYRSYPGHNYYPNDPDDRNNPNHPDYIGPPGSGSYYRRWR